MTLRYNICVIYNVSFNNYQYFHTVFALLDNHTMLKGGKISIIWKFNNRFHHKQLEYNALPVSFNKN